MTTTLAASTVTTFPPMGFIGTVGVAVTLALIGVLVARELVSAGSGHAAIRWERWLNTSIVPLLIAFAVIVAVKVTETL